MAPGGGHEDARGGQGHGAGHESVARPTFGTLEKCHFIPTDEIIFQRGRYTTNQYIYILYIYMVIDLKVLVRSFNCESRAGYVGTPRESVFFEFAKATCFFVKVSRKLDIMIIIHMVLYNIVYMFIA